jgi:hypothetical protein
MVKLSGQRSLPAHRQHSPTGSTPKRLTDVGTAVHGQRVNTPYHSGEKQQLYVIYTGESTSGCSIRDCKGLRIHQRSVRWLTTGAVVGWSACVLSAMSCSP